MFLDNEEMKINLEDIR